MAYTTLILKNPHTGQTKEAPIGYSWTMFFCSFLVPFYRKDYATGFVLFIFCVITSGLISFLYAFFYNKQYLKQCIDKGYQIAHSPMPVEQVAAKLNMPLPVLEG